MAILFPNPVPVPASVDDVLTALKLERDGYLQDLMNDALTGTQPDYSLDGQTVNRDAWRDGLLKKIGIINETILMYEPYECHSVGWGPDL